MAPKVKGLFKGFKYITQIFVYKEPELEIGYPTDVRHVAHIGWDNASSNAPSWMSHYNSASDLSPASFNDYRGTSWASPRFEIMRRQQSSLSYAKSTDSQRPEIPKPSKKLRRRKAKASSPVMSRSSSRTSFTTAFEEPDESPNHLPTAYEEPDDMQNQLQPAVTESVFIEADISVTWKMHRL